jgi:hypothetical protein
MTHVQEQNRAKLDLRICQETGCRDHPDPGHPPIQVDFIAKLLSVLRFEPVSLGPGHKGQSRAATGGEGPKVDAVCLECVLRSKSVEEAGGTTARPGQLVHGASVKIGIRTEALA